MELSDNDEQLVADLVADFAVRFRDGADVSPQNYLDRLPSEAMKQAFKEAANMTRMISVMEQVRKDEVVAKPRSRMASLDV
jgi:hypothetical protein